jgi:hypothetical protein
MLGDNYEKNWQYMHNNDDKDLLPFDIKPNEYDLDSYEYRLLNSISFEDYDDALSTYSASIAFYSSDRLAKIL